MTPVAIGVDVGGTKVLALALGLDGEVIDTQRVETPHVESSRLEPVKSETRPEPAKSESAPELRRSTD